MCINSLSDRLLVKYDLFCEAHKAWNRPISLFCSAILAPLQRHTSLATAAIAQLRSNGIDCCLWGEYALLYHGVDTGVFDIYILVSSPEQAASILIQNGYHRAPPDRLGNYHFEPEFLNGSTNLTIPKDTPFAPLVILSPAHRWHVTENTLAAQRGDTPPLSVLASSIIDTYLDAESSTPYNFKLDVWMAYMLTLITARPLMLSWKLPHQYQKRFWKAQATSKGYILDSQKEKFLSLRREELAKTASSGDT
ncbi:MAG: hypothetical protein Q9162_003977 [Coniocarpon cinnabarinum]